MSLLESVFFAPAYNEAATIQESLRALLALNYLNLEIILGE